MKNAILLTFMITLLLGCSRTTPDEEWNMVKQLNNIICYNSFILNYPSSLYVDSARTRIANIRRYFQTKRDIINEYRSDFAPQFKDLKKIKLIVNTNVPTSIPIKSFFVDFFRYTPIELDSNKFDAILTIDIIGHQRSTVMNRSAYDEKEKRSIDMGKKLFCYKAYFSGKMTLRNLSGNQIAGNILTDLNPSEEPSPYINYSDVPESRYIDGLIYNDYRRSDVRELLPHQICQFMKKIFGARIVDYVCENSLFYRNSNPPTIYWDGVYEAIFNKRLDTSPYKDTLSLDSDEIHHIATNLLKYRLCSRNPWHVQQELKSRGWKPSNKYEIFISHFCDLIDSFGYSNIFSTLNENHNQLCIGTNHTGTLSVLQIDEDPELVTREFGYIYHNYYIEDPDLGGEGGIIMNLFKCGIFSREDLIFMAYHDKVIHLNSDGLQELLLNIQ